MRKRVRFLISFFLLPIILAGCIVVPWHDDYGYGHHHDGYRGRGGWYDGRR